MAYRLFSVVVGAFLAMALLIGQSIAAKIEILPNKLDGVPQIKISGEIKLGDETKFENIALQVNKAFVVLESPGGVVVTGLAIGRAIRFGRFATLVPPGADCASACGLIWLGGQERFVVTPGRVGFHAAFNSQTMQQTGTANAQIGAYLNQMGLNTYAIDYLTSAAPQEMEWLSPEAAETLGIDVNFVNPAAAAPATPQVVANPPASPPGKELVIKFGWDIYGGDIAHLKNVASAMDCNLQCAGNADCAAYTFNPNQNACFLKNSGERAWKMSGVISGYRSEIENRIRIFNFEFLISTALSGDVLRTESDSKTEDCIAMCEGESSCTGITFERSKGGLCTMFQGRVQAYARKKVTSAIKTN